MTASWATPWAVVTGQLLGSGLTAVLALVTDEPAGRLLAALAGLLLLTSGLCDAVARPALAADAAGLDVAEGLRRRRVPWDEIVDIRVDSGRRRSRGSRWLEVDLGEHLVLLPRRRLGTDIGEVADVLAELREEHARSTGAGRGAGAARTDKPPQSTVRSTARAPRSAGRRPRGA